MLKVQLEILSKFDTKADQAIFLGYASSTKAFKFYNLRTRIIMELIHVIFDDKIVIGLQTDGSHDTVVFKNKNEIDIKSSEDEVLPKVSKISQRD